MFSTFHCVVHIFDFTLRKVFFMCYAYLVSTENVHVAEPVLFQDEGETCDWHLLPKNSTYAQRVSVHTANRDQKLTVLRGILSAWSLNLWCIANFGCYISLSIRSQQFDVNLLSTRFSLLSRFSSFRFFRIASQSRLVSAFFQNRRY